MSVCSGEKKLSNKDFFSNTCTVDVFEQCPWGTRVSLWSRQRTMWLISYSHRPEWGRCVSPEQLQSCSMLYRARWQSCKFLFLFFFFSFVWRLVWLCWNIPSHLHSGGNSGIAVRSYRLCLLGFHGALREASNRCWKLVLSLYDVLRISHIKGKWKGSL